MAQLTAWEWLGVYLGAGACLLVLMRLYVTLILRPPQASGFATDMLAAIRADQPFDWRKKAESVLFMPLALLVWPLAIWVGISEILKPARTHTRPEPEPEPEPQEQFRCQKQHLRIVTSPAEAEKLGLVTDPLGRAPALPFGHLNAAWLAFLSKNEAGFTLWFFEVPLEDARVHRARACRGFAWVKSRKVQAEFVFEWN